VAAIRTFIAIMLDASLHGRLTEVVESLATSGASIKWVSPENTHITLKFLGNVDEARLPEIFAACRRAADGPIPFDIEMKTVGCFPDSRRPKVVWLGIGKGVEKVKELNQSIEAELESVGFSLEERAFRAHLTIGRVKGRQGIPGFCHMLEDKSDVIIGSMRAEKISVMKSKTLPSGPVYTELEAIRLA
jgi:2'-5' RNA ligase